MVSPSMGLAILQVLVFIVPRAMASLFFDHDYPSVYMKPCKEAVRSEVTGRCCKDLAISNRKSCLKNTHSSAESQCDEKTAFDKYCYKITLKNGAAVILRAEVFDITWDKQDYNCDGKKKTDHNLTRGQTSHELVVSQHSFVKVYIVSTDKDANFFLHGSGTIRCTGHLLFSHVECPYPGGKEAVKLGKDR